MIFETYASLFLNSKTISYVFMKNPTLARYQTS